jgi:hypothetical protein
MKRKCPYTMLEFEAKRTNQIYINADARNAFNNEKARKIRMKKNPTDYVITKNWNILIKELGGSESLTKSKEYMLGAGFDFNFFHRAYKTDGGIMHSVYDCGIIIESDEVRIYRIR